MQPLKTNNRKYNVIDLFYHIFEHQGHGHLVAITSVGGLRAEPMAPVYSATKAYVTKRWHLLAIINRSVSIIYIKGCDFTTQNLLSDAEVTICKYKWLIISTNTFVLRCLK